LNAVRACRDNGAEHDGDDDNEADDDALVAHAMATLTPRL